MLVFFRRHRMQFDLRNHRFDELTPPPNFQLLEWQPRLLTAHGVATVSYTHLRAHETLR